MRHLFEVTTEDIVRLTDHQLTSLLSRLLHLEVRAANIPAASVSVSTLINVPDGGEDGLVSWKDGPPHTEWIPNRLTLFQSKATDMPPGDCKKEICVKRSTQLKPRVEAVLDEGGSYILFYSRNCNSNQQTPRLEKFREALSGAGKDYADNADIRIYDANKIAAWTNQFISAIVAVQRWSGHHLPSALMTWGEWEKYNENSFLFVSDETLAGHIARLRKHFSSPHRVGRIVGLSGLGKTRLALEAFRPPKVPKSDPMQQILSDQLVYLDAASVEENLPALIAEWRTQKISGIFIVDNCDPDLHKKLSKEVEHADSLLSLLTLDYNPDKPRSKELHIELKPVPYQLIKLILKQTYEDLQDSNIERIALLTEGFPQMAVLFAEAHLSETGNFGSLDDDALVSRLLWGRSQINEEAYRVVSSCAIFKHLGFKDGYVEQRYFAADTIAHIDRDRFYEHVQYFIGRGILEVRGRFINVKPQPLAIRLASDWWKKCPPERAVKLLTGDMPNGMSRAMYGRFAKLDFLPEAREIVRRICSDSASFSLNDMLNSEKGLRLFDSLVEVYPASAAAALERVFSDDHAEQLLEVQDTSYYLVSALEKLCFWADAFAIAARLLLLITVRESKRAGGGIIRDTKDSFTRLFKAILPGTQASLSDRLQFVKEEMNSLSVERKAIVIEAVGEALETDYFGRPSGIDTQGSRASLTDYYPHTWSEVFDYWRAHLKILLPYVCGGDEDSLAVLARQQLAERISGLVRYRLIEEVSEVVRAVVEKNGYFWEARGPVQAALTAFGDKLTDEERTTLQQLADLLEPRLMRDRLRIYVSEASYNDAQEESEEGLVDQSEKAATALAEGFAQEPDLWIENVFYLLLGRQNYGYEFGYRMGQVIESPQFFVEIIIKVLSLLSPQQTNTIIFSGFLSAVQTRDPQLVRQTIDRFASDEKLRLHALPLMFGLALQEEDLRRALELVKDGHVNVLSLRHFASGQRLGHFLPERIIAFADDLLEYGLEGAWAALDILYMQTVSKPENWEIYKHKLREVVAVQGILSDPHSMSQMRTHYWSQAIEKLLLDGVSSINNGDLAHRITIEIADASTRDINCSSLHYAVESLLPTLLRGYRHITLPIFGDALLSEDERGDSSLAEVLGYGRYRYFDNFSESGNEGKRDVLFTPPFRDLLAWCEQHTERGALILARMMPLWAHSKDKEFNWHPFAIAMFDMYGDQDDFLALVEERIGFFSWSGYSAPHYNQRIQALEGLLSHTIVKVRNWANLQIRLIRERLNQAALYEEERLIIYN